MLWNTFNFGGTNTTAPDQFKIDVGVYNPVIGKGYGELAAESRSNHKTQGFGSPRQRGESFEYFKTILGDAPQTDLMDGVNTTWNRVKDGEAIGEGINAAHKNFSMNSPELSVPALVQLHTKIEKLPDAYWRVEKLKELDNMIAACAGLWFESYAAEPSYALGDSIRIASQVLNRYSTKVKLNSISIAKSSKEFNGMIIPANQVQTFNSTAVAGKITQPYWLETPHTQGSYNIPNQLSVGNPENPDLPKVNFEFVMDGKLISFERRLVYKYTDAVRGEVYQPIEIAPPVTANIENRDYIFNSQKAQSVTVKLKSFTKAEGSISMKPIAGWKINPEKFDFTNKSKGDEWSVTFSVSPTDNMPKTTVLEAVADVNGKQFSMGLQRIKYEHVPNITLFPPSQAKLINIDLKIAGKKIGYIPGAGDLVQDALKQVGYDVHQLTENEILNGDLSVYDAIVTGVRAYNVNERLAFEQPKLMEYVKNGGNLVVQYNNNNGLVTKQIGPYPFSPINQRVTDEDAKVTILDQQNPVLNYPNAISQDDFTGWIQERGLYFVSDIDPQYKTVLQMNDPANRQIMAR